MQLAVVIQLGWGIPPAGIQLLAWNETLGSRNAPQLENMNEWKQINNPKIRFKAENKNQMLFESVLKLAGVWQSI